MAAVFRHYTGNTGHCGTCLDTSLAVQDQEKEHISVKYPLTANSLATTSIIRWALYYQTSHFLTREAAYIGDP